MRVENALIARVCHDLITPLNAIGLGMEAYDATKDEALLNCVRESVNKANAILKFMRELYSLKSSTFCYSRSSLQQLVANFLEKYSILFELQSDFENIPSIAGKIIMYNAILAHEILHTGGMFTIKIDDDSREIVATYSGKSVAVPDLNECTELNHKNIMRFSLLRMLDDAGFKIATYQEGYRVIIRERMV
ncbi:MAG: hypothetical protein LBB12_00500 [Holosporaceae bacterium]|jgi:hypothetical protein|nr:hypothetical protein [Holosporaceae bacterium]